ncbi:auxilin-like protein 1 isoform X2 [Fagus crenata]
MGFRTSLASLSLMGFRFVTTATLSPCAEDYSEIFESFHASRASSIPVLDLPTVDEAEAEVFSDVQSSGFDYSEVFGGGFDGLDCATSFEDLLYDGSNGRNVRSSSSEEEACVVAGFYCAFRFVG